MSKTMRPLAAFAFALLLLVWSGAAFAAPNFPPLTGRVVDNAELLSPEQEAALTQKLAGLEERTGSQLVVATLPSLQDYPIEDFGYQLGRFWQIGSKAKNDGALLLVAPNERKVRIEVGYGLEGVLTDALSSTIIQAVILPKFRGGDFAGGIEAGADQLIGVLDDPASAQARVAQLAPSANEDGFPPELIFFLFVFVIFFLLPMLRRRSFRSGGLAAPWIISDWGGGGRGGWGGGGGGFGGGGGSFGGGGSSGSW